MNAEREAGTAATLLHDDRSGTAAAARSGLLARRVGALRERLGVRFVVVGVLNTAFSYLVYAFFVFLGLPFQVANLLALVMGIAVSFKTSGRFVFRNTDNRLFGRYVANWTVIYLASVLLIGGFMKLGADAYVAGLMALPLTTGLSFLSQKFLVFRRPGSH